MGREYHYSTEIDGNLLAEAMRISGLNTKAAVLNLALSDFKQMENNSDLKIYHF